MRIKKKYVLKESLLLEGILLDDLKQFTPRERKILKSLYKKYYKPNDPDFSWWRLNANHIQTELHEDWQLPFNVAYKMTKVFVLHGDELFTDNRINTNYSSSEILMLYMDDFMDNYRKSLDEDLIVGGDWILDVDGKKGLYTPHFWSSYRGFILYLAQDVNTVMVRGTFDFESDKENPTIKITYRLGSDDNEYNKWNGVLLDNAIIDLPDEVTKQSMQDWIDDFVKNHIEVLIKDFKFPQIN